MGCGWWLGVVCWGFAGGFWARGVAEEVVEVQIGCVGWLWLGLGCELWFVRAGRGGLWDCGRKEEGERPKDAERRQVDR